jgi:hypothetical protein
MVRLVLTDSAHMQITFHATQPNGTNVPGLGSQAVGMKEAAFIGGYVVNVLDAKGGFGISIIGQQGTPERSIALARVVESHR